MKRSRLIMSALGVAAVASSVLMYNSTKENVSSKYAPTLGSLAERQSASAYQEWIESRMIDMETGDVIAAEKLQAIMKAHNLKPKSLIVDWLEHGPDNIGGRTRAILIDHQNINNVWSGGVTGGLYYSPSRANYWSRVENFPGNQMISSIAQDKAGNIYVATGSLQEGSTWLGNGLYVSPDKGETWELVPGTENISKINRVIGSRFNDHVLFTANSGFPLRKYTYGGTVENVEGYPGTAGARTLAISDDGEIVVLGSGNSRTFVSTDRGLTYEDRSGTSTGEINAGGVARIEYAISKKKSDGTYSIYASTANQGNNQGQWISLNTGQTWHRHTPATPAGITNGVIDFRGQGLWNNVATFDPTDPRRAIIGGIDLHEWKQVIDNPPSGGWNKISLWFVSPTSPLYVHADNHELKWDDNNILYIGNDGGVNKSDDLAQTFYPANRGYNITQFFKIAYDRDGAVIGGTQDNGALYNNHKNHTYLEFRQVTGGDGFSAAISFFNPNLLITSSQYNNINRSADGGQTFNPLVPRWPTNQYTPVGSEGGEHPFHTEFYLAEYFDLNSEDSVIFVPQKSYAAGDLVRVPSLATGDTIDYITPDPLRFSDTLFYDPSLTRTEYVVQDQNSGISYDLGIFPFDFFASASQQYPPLIGDSLLVDGPLGLDTVVVASVDGYTFFVGKNDETGQTLDMVRDSILLGISWDTITVQDPFQSWFVVSTSRNGGELWGTRDALRLSVQNPKWARIATDLGSSVMDIEFSEDMQHMFVCGAAFKSSTEANFTGRLYRIDGLGSVYSTDPEFFNKVDTRPQFGASATTKLLMSNTTFAGIGIDPRNPNVLVATQMFNGNVFRSNNATSDTPTFTNVGSQGGLAFYDVVVDRNDNDILFAATSVGVSLSEDGGATWVDVSDPSFAGTPCYHIEQSWRTWEEGNKRPGVVFVGTHGRGIFSTEAVLSTVDNTKPKAELEKKKSMLSIYPNPSRDNSTLVIDVKNEGVANILFFNLSGSVVKSINKTDVYVGRNEVFFSASDLPQGTYIVRVQIGNQIETTKYIKM